MQKEPTAGAADEAATDESLWDELDAAEAGTPPAESTSPEPPSEPTPGQEAEAEGQPQPEQQTDPWATAPPPLKEERDRLTQRVTSAEGRIAAYQRRYEEANAQVQSLNARLRELESAPAAQPEPPKEDEATAHLKRIREEYPEIGEPLVAIIDGMRKQNAELTRWQQQQIEREMIQQDTILRDEHPDWQDVTSQNAEAFLAWVNEQTPERRKVIEDNAEIIKDGRAAASVIADFKAHIAQKPRPEPAPAPQAASQQQPNPKRARQLAGAETAKPSGRQAFAPGIPEEGDPEEIWKAIEAEEKATRRAAP